MEYNGVGFVEISRIFVTQDAFFFGIILTKLIKLWQIVSLALEKNCAVLLIVLSPKLIPLCSSQDMLNSTS